jgi:hypothetical protein
MLFGSRWETGSRSGEGAFPEKRAFWKKMLGTISGLGLFIFSSGLGLFFFSSGLGLFFFSSAQLQ